MNTMPTEPIKTTPQAKSLCQAGTPAFLVDRRKPVAGDTSGGIGSGATEAGGGVRGTPWAGTTGTIGTRQLRRCTKCWYSDTRRQIVIDRSRWGPVTVDR
ncbi:unnamed protein product [Gadus morhua 'NCC']